MPLWPVKLRPLVGRNMTRVVPEEILVELDEPLTLTFKDDSGTLLLGHLCSSDERVLRYVVAPTTGRIIEQLKDGTRSILGALDQPIVWLMDVGADAAVVNIWVGTLSELPSGVLPASDVMLRADLSPMLRLRAVGSQILPGVMPVQVIRSLIGGAEDAVRGLTNYITQRTQVGRPPEKHRLLYQLQAQQFAFRSFEVAFRPVDPTSGQLVVDKGAVETAAEVERLLSLGLQWSQRDTLESSDIREQQAILNAIKALSPGKGSHIQRVEVSGRVIPSDMTAQDFPRLTFETRQRAGQAIKDLKQDEKEPEYHSCVGRIGEADVDNQTAKIRRENQSDFQVHFEVEFLDDVLDALNTQDYVSTVAVKFEDGRFWLVSILPIDDARSSGDSSSA